jgi:hypothetical protein
VFTVHCINVMHYFKYYLRKLSQGFQVLNVMSMIAFTCWARIGDVFPVRYEQTYRVELSLNKRQDDG